MLTTAAHHDDTALEELAFRKKLMAACAFANESELVDIVEHFKAGSDADDVRKPELGMVMVRGRIGGDGAPFNAGEATVVRAAVRLACGRIGFSYLLGRATKRARLAAIVDALGQHDINAAKLRTDFLEPVMRRQATQRGQRRADTAATRVDFFTLVRGDD